MARSVDRAALSIGLGHDACRRLQEALAVASAPRVARLEDDHHPAYLHPGRSVLVLLRDVGAPAAGSLDLAAVLESEDAALAADRRAVLEALGPGVAEAMDSIPRPGEERLGERLLLLERPVALAALAERLDHLRHLHLRPDLRDVWADRHRETAAVWAGFAERMHPRLGTRYAHWVRAFRSRI